MRRFAVVSLVMGMILVMAPPVVAQTPAASVDPSSGPAGSAATVFATGYVPGFTIEVHGQTIGGPLLGSALADSSGNANIPITIPGGAAAGTYTLAVCLTGGGINCGDEFSSPTFTTFTVISPPTTTITIPTTTPPATVAPPTTTAGLPVSGDPCVIPSDAVVIDFDAWDRSMGDTLDLFGDLQTAMISAGHPLEFTQWEWYAVRPPPGTQMSFGLSVFDSLGYVTNNPARDLWTTSPPNVMRLIDDTHWTLLTNWGVGYGGNTGPVPNLPAQPDYIGFNVGFGHFGEGFETPENLVVELRVRQMPIRFFPEDVILDQGAWETVSITLGPGPQAVTQCLMATNTLGGVADRWSVYLIDILPRTTAGDPVHIPVDIDDFFYGFESSPLAPPVLDEPLTTIAPPVITTELTLPFIEQPIELPELPSGPSYLPWLIGFGLAGLLIGAGVVWGFRRRT